MSSLSTNKERLSTSKEICARESEVLAKTQKLPYCPIAFKSGKAGTLSGVCLLFHTGSLRQTDVAESRTDRCAFLYGGSVAGSRIRHHVSGLQYPVCQSGP